MTMISFNVPQLVGAEHVYIDSALREGKLSGNGRFGQRCSELLAQRLHTAKALLTPSCTAALEMAALLCELSPDDEVIVPSFTFVSTANAFVLHGAVPVFVDISPDTLNIDPDEIEAAITSRTRAIVVVHYGGVACEMDRIMDIAAEYNLMVIEDAAHSLPATWRGRPLGSIGELSTFSFHETKNVQCGEGGALVINHGPLVARAEVLQEKGTDRALFFRGEADKYTWRDVGSSYLLSDIAAAFLWAQMKHMDAITTARRAIWTRYHEAFAELEERGWVRRPVVPDDCVHSGHLYYLLLPTARDRDAFIVDLAARGVHAVFHYVPLHSSPAGQRFGRATGSMTVTDDVSSQLVRLPLWVGLEQRQDEVIDAVFAACRAVITAPVAP
jgi:dTDP-4-amino-4,6-dideoxygalactose transaminase